MLKGDRDVKVATVALFKKLNPDVTEAQINAAFHAVGVLSLKAPKTAKPTPLAVGTRVRIMASGKLVNVPGVIQSLTETNASGNISVKSSRGNVYFVREDQVERVLVK